MNDLRNLVASGDPVSLHDALTLAVGLSVTAVREQLDYDFLEAHAGAASKFLRAWLPRLAPFERMQAAEWVTSQYLLSMVHLDHAYGIGARLQLEALNAATASLATALDGFWAFAHGPDAEVGENVAATLRQLSETVRDVAVKLSSEVDRLPRLP
jgi:hypothetical protein